MITQVQEYRAAVVACAMAASFLAQHDLHKLLLDIEKADGLGPVLDPTLWRAKRKAMGEDRELLEAASALWRVGRRLEQMRAEGGPK